MATKRQKKEKAKRLIDDAVPTLPVPRFAPAPVKALNLVLRGAETLGQGLVEIDPLNILTDDKVVAAMVNEPSVQLTPEFVALVNDDTRMVAPTSNGLVEVSAPIRSAPRRVASTPANFRQAFARRVDLPPKRTRKKTKTDKNMSRALREANARLRTKNGRLRKGKTQADVMRLAHRLRKKMS